VNSVLAQDYRNTEVIIINDGTIAVPPFSDPRVRVIDSGQRGAVPARNMGVAVARGEAIAWLDDDDIWTEPYFLSAAANALTERNDFVFADGALVFPDGRRAPFAKNADAATLERDNTILISAVCYRRALHLQLGLFDEALPYYWDWDWYLRVTRAACVLTRLVLPVVDIRIHENNMSGLANAEPRRKNLDLLCAKHALTNIELKSHINLV
jgi:glycosyltransferase involved in cell wall biosynthesis